jgi:hypothetical protein
MKKRSLIFGIAMLIGMALISIGCEQEATTETQTVTNGAAADITALEALLATDGVSTVDYIGTLDIVDEALVIPAGKTVNVKGSGVKIKDGTLGVLGTLNLPSGAGIAVSGGGHVFGSVAASIVSGTTPKQIYVGVAAAKDAFETETEVAIVNVSAADLATGTVPANKTLHVLGDLTVAANADEPEAEGSVKAEGKVIFAGDVDVSDWDRFDISQAILKNSADATVTLPATALKAKAIDLTTDKLTIDGAAAGLTVGSVTVKEGAELIVSEDAKLTISGNASVAGDLTVSGNAIIAGTVTVASGGKIVSPALAATGLPNANNKITFGDTGAIELAYGAIGYYGDVAFIGPAPATGTNPYIYNWDTGAVGIVTLKGNNVTELTSGNVTAVKSTAIPSQTTISIGSGAKLTVASDVTFTVVGTLAVTGTIDATAGTLTVSGGTITVTGDGKVIEDVSDGFPLATGTGTSVDDPRGTSANLEAAVLKTSAAEGFTTFEVTLTPKASTTLSWFDKDLATTGHGYNLWGPSDSSAPTDWKWTDFSFDVDSALITLSTSNVVSFKVESFSYYYYAGNAGNATAVPAYPRANDLGSIYIPATYNINTIPVRWRGYDKGHFSSSNKDLTLLLTSGGSKILTLKIYSHTNNDAAAAESANDTGTHVSTLIIDYTALTPPQAGS